MNTPNRPSLSQSSKSLAFLFLLIALVGVMLALRNPSQSKPEVNLPNRTDTTFVQPQATYPVAGKGPSLTGYILRTILFLGALVLFLYYGVRFYRRKTQPQAGAGGQIKVVGKYYFSPKQYLAAVVWNDRELLLGVTESQFTKLAEIDLAGESPEDFSDQLEHFDKGPLHG